MQALACRLHLKAAPHGGRGRAPAGHSFHTGAPVSQPSTTQPPWEATWHPGPQDWFAIALPAVTKLVSSTARNISLIAKLQLRPSRSPRSDLERRPLHREAWSTRSVPAECATVLFRMRPTASSFSRYLPFACDETPRRASQSRLALCTTTPQPTNEMDRSWARRGCFHHIGSDRAGLSSAER